MSFLGSYWTETKYWLSKINHPRIILGGVILLIVVMTFSVNFQRKTSFLTFVVQRPLLQASAPKRIDLSQGPWPEDTLQEDLFPGSRHVMVYTKQGAKKINGVRATGDFDGDGREDIIEATEEQLHLELSTLEEDLWQLTHNKRIASVGFDDVNGDGHIDAWWMDASKRYIGVLWGAEDKTYYGCQTFNVYDYVMPESATFIDMDGDGQLDILIEGQGITEKHNDPETPWTLYWLRLSHPQEPVE
ncbi:MAG: FG-GAP repeat domain-containing protein [Candidatus Sumerlaeota bacterium]